MRNALKFILAVATAIVLMLVVRTYAFTIYKVSDNNLYPVLKKNDRVVVNKLPYGRFSRGDMVVFGEETAHIGMVENIPGDTVAIDGRMFVLPERCGCQQCGCSRKAVFMVLQGKCRTLLHRDDIIGKAFKISLTRQ
ncbi:signal peptidase I [Prevotella sp. OH937_COT-195]|uniref:signal peptidase I n=1 Tax=Prevotella sp. OH937_COT-195 TaxID=2491051 RepID=UPI000F653FB9|nr:signal peptidase I [Prevotella sp. OH937_COT-195]RRC98721.1 signal peptidase I [Prevotella sp. OH937_COT-195]